MQKVLIVDDEQRTLEGVAQRVKDSGLDVEIAGLAHDGLEALELTQRHHPGILLCDIRMPGMDGIAFSLKAKQIDPDIAVIFMSGYSDREYLKTAIRIGAIDYLDKPVDECQFKEALERAIQRRKSSEGMPAQAFDQETLRLLLTGNNEDILRQTAGAALHTPAEYIILAAMHYKHENTVDTEQQINMFTLHMISSFSEDPHYRYTTIRMGDMIVMLIKDERTGAGGTLTQRVTELADTLLTGLPGAREHIAIGIGSRFQTLMDAGSSYRAACKALDLAFFRGIGSVNTAGNRKGGQYKPGESQLAEIASFCAHNEPLRITETVERIYGRFAENPDTPVSHIKSVTLRICQILEDNYHKEFLEGLSDDPVGLQKAVMSAFTLDQLMGILYQLINKYTSTILTKDKKIGAIYSAKRYIWRHLDGDISVKAIARNVYLSPTYLCALFKEVTGITINQYVQQARMDKAKTLLVSTDHTVNEISDMVGYRNVGYFSRVFNQHTGTSPNLYKKMSMDV